MKKRHIIFSLLVLLLSNKVIGKEYIAYFKERAPTIRPKENFKILKNNFGPGLRFMLIESEKDIENIVPINQFPQTDHYEIIVNIK